MCGISTVELCRSCVRLFVPVRAGGVCGGGVCPVPVCFNPVEPWGSQEEFWAEGPCFPLKSFQRCVEDVYSFRVEFDGACFFAELSETMERRCLTVTGVSR